MRKASRPPVNDRKSAYLRAIREILKVLDEKTLHDVLLELKTFKSAPTPAHESQRKAAEPLPMAIKIEASPDRTGYTLVTAKSRSDLTRTDMSALVKASYASSQQSECLNALFIFLSQQRKDILRDAGVEASGHLFCKTLYQTIRNRFRLKSSGD